MDSLMRSITRTHRFSKRFYNEKLQEDGISGKQQTYIFQICRRPGIPQEQLARRIAVNKSNVTRQLAVLEQNGFILRQPSPDDKRNLLVYPTEKAEAVYPKVLQVMEEWNQLLLEDFSAEEKEQLLQMMAKIQQKAAKLTEEQEVAD